jgi:hypothetical protein
MGNKLYKEAIKTEGLKLAKSATEKKEKQKQFCQQHLYICNKSREFQVLNLCRPTSPARHFTTCNGYIVAE